MILFSFVNFSCTSLSAEIKIKFCILPVKTFKTVYRISTST